ncbi:MAG: IclR family transcriptional regulator, partial [Candidatus Aerophobetes bacterium]|nr:IclR family transcriptional regulator [Candidatus Aerophobetes bacterium]
MNKLSGRVKSIERALNILEAFSKQKIELSITELSRMLRMKTSTVHRILATLKERGYIKQSSPKTKYELGIKVFELGCIFRNQMHFTKIAMPYLKYLCNLTKETTHLAILDDSSAEVIYIAQVASPGPLRTSVEVGTRWKAHCTAIGKALLAFLPQEKIEEMFANQKKLSTYTPNSISDVNEL